MAVQGTTNKTYISSIAFLDQREILEDVLDVTSEDATIVDIMDVTNRFEVTDVPEFDHFENQYLYTAGVIATIDATNNGEDAGATNETLVMTLSSLTQMPLVGEIAMFQNKREGYVSAINTGTLSVTVSPLSNANGDALSPVGNTVATGQTVIFKSNAAAEGSSDPVGRRPEFTRSQNSIQIFKTANKITDLQKVSKIEVKYNGKNYIMYKLQHDTLQKHRSDISFDFLTGKRAKFTDPNGTEPIYKTQGLRNYILGGDGSVNTSGGVDIPLTVAVTQANLRTMNRALDKRGAPSEYWLWAGGDVSADFDEILLTMEGVKNGVVYNSWGQGDGKSKALDYGVDSFKIYGRTMHKKLLKAYDHPQVFGASGFNFGGEAYLIPQGKLKADKSGTMKERMRARYMAGDGTDLKHLETLTGKLAPTPTSEEAVLKVGYQTVAGTQALGIRQFGIFSKA